MWILDLAIVSVHGDMRALLRDCQSWLVLPARVVYSEVGKWASGQVGIAHLRLLPHRRCRHAELERDDQPTAPSTAARTAPLCSSPDLNMLHSEACRADPDKTRDSSASKSAILSYTITVAYKTLAQSIDPCPGCGHICCIIFMRSKTHALKPKHNPGSMKCPGERSCS